MTGNPRSPIHDSTYCGAKKRQSGGCCMHPAGWGTGHVGIGRCKLHGGCTPTHRQSAALASRVDTDPS